MADSLKGRRKRGTALDSITRRANLEKGFPTRDPLTGAITIRKKGSNPIIIDRGNKNILDMLAGAARTAFSKVKNAAPKPPKPRKSRVSPEHRLSDTTRGAGIVKRGN